MAPVSPQLEGAVADVEADWPDDALSEPAVEDDDPADEPPDPDVAFWVPSTRGEAGRISPIHPAIWQPLIFRVPLSPLVLKFQERDAAYEPESDPDQSALVSLT